jgi:probable DNA repair protein
VWPTPRVRDYSGWLKERHAARRLEDARLPRLLGDAEERELWRGVIDGSALAVDILDPAAAVRAVRRARRAMHEYAIPRERIARHAALCDESHAFLEWNRAFEQRCRMLDCIDAAELLANPSPADEPLAWVDNAGWRPVARRWLEARTAPLAPSAIDAGGCGRLHTPSQAAELASMAAWAARRLDESEEFRAWICVPGLEQRRAEVVDAFDAALAPRRFGLAASAGSVPYAIAGGTPLADFAPVRAALDLLDAAGGAIGFETFSALLRSPQLQGSLAQAGRAAQLDIELRARGPAEAPLAGWLDLAQRLAAARNLGAVGAIQRLGAALPLLDQGGVNRPISRWIPAWISAFDLAPWADRGHWSSVEFQAAERLRELLTELAAADAIFGAQSPRAARGVLRRAALETPFQAQTGVPRIAVSGQLMDPWLPYDGLWVAGCVEERWPPRADPIALLPVALQREFGVISAASESQLQFATELQQRWACRARECTFSYADPGDGRSATPSPLLPRQASAARPALPQPHWRALLEAAPPLERFGDELAPVFAAQERTRGVATLQAQSRCAFRGFAETRLRCERLERPLPGFNDRERGDLVHHALEQVWSELGDSERLHSLTQAAREALIDAAAVRAIAKVAGRRDPGPRWRVRERQRLSDVLSRWLDLERQRQPFTVERIEHRVQVARFGGLQFDVRLDRMDRLDDGTRVLIDYKTGGAGADWRGERPDNPQLPMYALLNPADLVAVAYAKVNAADLGFVAESGRDGLFRPGAKRSRLEGLADFPALIALWDTRIEKLARDFAAGQAEVAPTAIACKSCRLQGLCRVPAALEDGSGHE